MGVKSWWSGLGRGAQIGFAAGVVVIVAATAALAYWALRTDHDVLFGHLSAQDAAAMTRELDQMKVPYEIGADGTSILVDRKSVHDLRLKLMGRDIPLHGAVGFELFNNADFGMTEFAQKVTYQRALQGEITRTILSLTEVESARVHLALPDEGLFKRDRAQAKASVTLTMRHGHSLRREKILGIQRLVAAAVSGVEPKDVTIVSDQGIALTHAPGEGGAAASSLRMDLKRETEAYLAHKANELLEKTFGPGQAMSSIDVTLDMNQVRITKEDATAPAGAAGDAPIGLVLRERETLRETNRSGASSIDGSATAEMTHREVDYQLGRRVEQVVSSPGAITRLQALAVLKAPLDVRQVESVKQLLAAAVGANRERGDTIVVQPLDGLPAAVATEMPLFRVAADGSQAPVAPPPGQGAEAWPSSLPSGWNSWWSALLAVGAVAGLLAWVARRRTGTSVTPLSPEHRDASLRRVQAWLTEPGATTGDGTAQ